MFVFFRRRRSRLQEWSRRWSWAIALTLTMTALLTRAAAISAPGGTWPWSSSSLDPIGRPWGGWQGWSRRWSWVVALTLTMTALFTTAAAISASGGTWPWSSSSSDPLCRAWGGWQGWSRRWSWAVALTLTMTALYTTAAEDLGRLFSQYGCVTDVHIPLDHYTGEPRDVVYVQYPFLYLKSLILSVVSFSLSL